MYAKSLCIWAAHNVYWEGPHSQACVRKSLCARKARIRKPVYFDGTRPQKGVRHLDDADGALPHAPWFTLITRPREFFGSRQGKMPWVPFALLTMAVLMGTAWVQFQVVQHSALFQSYLQKLPQAQRPEAAAAGEILAPLGAALQYWIGLVLSSFLLWSVSKTLRLQVGFVQAVTLTVYANLATLLAAALTSLSVLSGGTLATFLSVGMLIPHASSAELSIADSLNVFTVWYWYIQASGIAVWSGASRRRAWAAVLVTWLVFFMGQVLLTPRAASPKP